MIVSIFLFPRDGPFPYPTPWVEWCRSGRSA